MKKGIHPEYHTKAKVKCACGTEFIVGSTLKETEVETCSRCHPLYTGQERGAIKGGRVEKFQERLQKKEGYKKKSEKRARKTEEKT
ncbi:MAG: 50S ribosomal protein L31 [Candidatus Spechtbacterales bacterium]